MSENIRQKMENLLRKWTQLDTNNLIENPDQSLAQKATPTSAQASVKSKEVSDEEIKSSRKSSLKSAKESPTETISNNIFQNKEYTLVTEETVQVNDNQAETQTTTIQSVSTVKEVLNQPTIALIQDLGKSEEQMPVQASVEIVQSLSEEFKMVIQPVNKETEENYNDYEVEEEEEDEDYDINKYINDYKSQLPLQSNQTIKQNFEEVSFEKSEKPIEKEISIHEIKSKAADNSLTNQQNNEILNIKDKSNLDKLIEVNDTASSYESDVDFQRPNLIEPLIDETVNKQNPAKDDIEVISNDLFDWLLWIDHTLESQVNLSRNHEDFILFFITDLILINIKVVTIGDIDEIQQSILKYIVSLNLRSFLY